jgi:hypothetical protein
MERRWRRVVYLLSHVGSLALHAALGPGGIAAASLSPPGRVSRVGIDLVDSGSQHKCARGLGVPECTPRLVAAVLGGACGRVPSSASITIHAVSQPLKRLAEGGGGCQAVQSSLRRVLHSGRSLIRLIGF